MIASFVIKGSRHSDGGWIISGLVQSKIASFIQLNSYNFTLLRWILNMEKLNTQGPITFYNGLQALQNILMGWKLATKDVCIP